ncbi:MAG: hypothetical protein IKU43_07875 [Clostridia bacterium]|nr:hypothetical protein [Clostridia bacterium]
MTDKVKSFGLSSNALKMIALVAMTLDHIGVQILTDSELLRIIGRLAFPIFAYTIAEGCTHTKNRKRYALIIGATALLCQLVYFFAMQSLYQCIFVTFLLSIIIIYTFDRAVKSKSPIWWIFGVALLLSVLFVTEFLPNILYKTDFYIDYGFAGVMVPVLIYFAPGKASKLTAALFALSLLAFSVGGIQWYSLFALPIIALYNGKRGTRRLKWFFYIYYPVHLVVIYAASLLI